MLRWTIVLAGAAVIAGCATKPQSFGEVPRDTRGQPIWSEVMKKATRPDLAPPQADPQS
ncbi:hypothetical protein ACFOMD_11785 [Sphingoaurantiacus capsulatus]|uniref:Lipoprotein n=1 Tax=Sphingoaurantiacus capsulatus TaxID=1771310 RepID=A0ABV7XD98_9SPHN